MSLSQLIKDKNVDVGLALIFVILNLEFTADIQLGKN